MLTSFCS